MLTFARSPFKDIRLKHIGHVKVDVIAGSSLIPHCSRTIPGATVDESGKLVKAPNWQPSVLDLYVQLRKYAGVH